MERALHELSVGCLMPGDLWAANGSDIRVVRVDLLPQDDNGYPGGWRITGVIERGFGRGKRERTWSVHAGTRVDVVMEGVWQ